MSQTQTTDTAAPPTATIDDISGRWAMNAQLSDSYDEIMKMQGVSWLTRKVLNVGTITASFKQTVDADGLTHLDIESKAGAGLPANVENRILNGEIRSKKHPLFGSVAGSTKWAELSDLPVPWLGEGWEAGTTKVVLMTTDHQDHNAITYQAGGFELVNGKRRYVRRVYVKKGSEDLKARLVYDYLGPLEA